jgi:hypothetical protein
VKLDDERLDLVFFRDRVATGDDFEPVTISRKGT